jgi:serine/threonine-protein kinase CHEK1
LGDSRCGGDSTNGASKITTANLLGTMAELQVTDSQLFCECDQHQQMEVTGGDKSAQAPPNTKSRYVGFSQPISTDDMLLNSQLPMTQTINSQFNSQFNNGASQSPLLKLVKRMTRFFVHSSAEKCTNELTDLFKRFMYDYRIAIINQRQRLITVTTSDKRQTLLAFKVNIIEINDHKEVLIDFRLSRGDGLEFKKIFMKIKSSLAHLTCKKYIFTNSQGCF